MAEEDGYRTPKATAVDLDKKCTEVTLKVPGIEVSFMKKLKDNCKVTCEFEVRSFEITAVIKKGDEETKYKYKINQLPGEINPDKCKNDIKYKDDLIILKLHKAKEESWQVQLKKGLEQA